MNRADLEDLLKQTIGLDIASVGTRTLEQAVKSRMASLGFGNQEDYWRCLQSSGDEFQELIESLVVPETWFFRDREAFVSMVRLLAEESLAFWLNSPLRILSVPCCSGEEPYSIGMALTDAGWPAEQIKIDAVDISRQAIARALRGVYGANSFRGDSLNYRDRHFERLPDESMERSTGGYRIAKRISDLVSFHHENILSASFRLDAGPYDVIFCRNLLIYFEGTKQDAVMGTLHRLLKPRGHLFVGPAEAVLAGRSGFKSVNHTMSFAFSKEERTRSLLFPPAAALPLPLLPDGPAARSLPPLPPLPPLKKAPELETRVSAKTKAHTAEREAKPKAKSRKRPDNEATSGPPNLEEIKRLADSGRLEEASILCEEHVNTEGQSAEGHYLLALIRDAKGEFERAEDCYRKVLYLEPSHEDALLHLALLYERQGNPDAAKRLRARARRSKATATS